MNKIKSCQIFKLLQALQLIYLVGECLGGLCMKFGSSIYVDIKDIILSGIRDNLERDMAKDESPNIYLEVSLL